MGQRQLLLLVLAIVLVGLATLTGIRIVSESERTRRSDALVQDALRIAADAQAWKRDAQAEGDPADYRTVTFGSLGRSTNPNGTHTTENGTCILTGTPTALRIECMTPRGRATAVPVDTVRVVVEGPADEDVSVTRTSVDPEPSARPMWDRD